MQAVKMSVGLNALRAHARANLVTAQSRARGIQTRPGLPGLVCQAYRQALQVRDDAAKLVAYDLSSAQPSTVTNADKLALRHAQSALKGALNALARAGYGVNSLGQCIPLANGRGVSARGANIGIAVPGLRPRRVRGLSRVGDVNQFPTQAAKDAAIAADTESVNALTATVANDQTNLDAENAALSNAQAIVNGIPNDGNGNADDSSQQDALNTAMSSVSEATTAVATLQTTLAGDQSLLSDAQAQLATDQSATVTPGAIPKPVQPNPANPNPANPNPAPVPAPTAGMSSSEKIALALVAAAVVVGGVALASGGKKGRK